MYLTSVDGHRIHFRTEGDREKPCLLLVHGFFGSIEDWYEYGYVERLKGSFFLVLIDVRGHGRSDKPKQAAAYELSVRAHDVICVLDSLDIRRADYLGYSMGGWIAYGLMCWYGDRIGAYVLNSTHPFATDLSELRESVRSMPDWVPWSGITEAHRKRFLENDAEALAAAVASDRADNSCVLRGLEVPCLFIYGGKDGIAERVREAGKLSPRISLHELEGADHIAAFTSAAEVCEAATRFFDGPRA